MPKKQITPAEKEITIRFQSHPLLGFSWSVVDHVPNNTVSGGGGHQSALEVLDDGDFLETLARGLGKASIPKNVVNFAKDRDEKSRQPISDEFVAGLEALYPGKAKVDRNKP